jgi:hypothetical protein
MQWMDASVNFNRWQSDSLQSRLGPMNKSESPNGKSQGLCLLHRVIFTGYKARNPDAYIIKV